MPLPDPFAEVRLVSLRTVPGSNLWSRRPVTRIDLLPGAYDDISSAQVPGFTDALLRALPGLWEHRCSVGERGGFVKRLRDGTYAPHIVEHVGLELQSMAGDDVGYGRARGGDRPGEYTVVFAHLHAGVGLRAATLAMETVQHALAGTLHGIEHAVAELRALAAVPEPPPPRLAVRCGITGGGDRGAVRAELLRRGTADTGLVVDVSPAYLLNAGLPYSASDTAVILDAAPRDVPERYRDPELARRLVTVLADAVPPGGIVVVPAGDAELRERVLDAGRRVAVFAADGGEAGDEGPAYAAAAARGGRIALERGGEARDAGPLLPEAPPGPQLAAALAALALEATQPHPTRDDAQAP